MKTEKLAELSVEELRREEEALKEQIFRTRFQLQTGNVENPSRLPLARRDLARVKTLLRERELGIGRRRRAAAARREGEEAPPQGGAGAAGSEVRK